MEKYAELKKIYYESGIWRKWNWYDFLERLADIIKRNEAN